MRGLAAVVAFRATGDNAVSNSDSKSPRQPAADEWTAIEPRVAAEAEFFEILNDFGNPLELLREAISNAIDAGATTLDVSFQVEEIEGARRLVIELEDDGTGMTNEVITRDFWGLGYSPSRQRSDAIGEKGHGTKIYLRSERIEVRTQSSEGAHESICDRPLKALSQKRLHEPRLRAIPPFREHSGTRIRIIGYNDNERSKFIRDIVKDYLLWFTKIGSVERIFKIDRHAGFKVRLKCLDQDEPEVVSFGHVFPDENSDIDKLFEERGTGAADSYVKRYVWPKERLQGHPEVSYEAVISVEGDGIKRVYNPMIRERRRSESGKYRVFDRYGIWLCKDFIPVVRVNDWITGFGSGSNAFVLLHGFVNCQSLKLTANRGTIANTDPKILEELQSAVQRLVADVDADLNKAGLYTLRGWHEESRTLEQERTEFARRVKTLRVRRVAKYNGRTLYEPSNESELFGLLVTVYALHPELFEFEPLDYNTTRGIDVIAKNKSGTTGSEGQHWYVELKYMLRSDFNHAFEHIRWIVCWDLDKSIGDGSEFRGIEDSDVRRLTVDTDDAGRQVYFLDNRKRAGKIQIIRLKEYLKERLNIEFDLA